MYIYPIVKMDKHTYNLNKKKQVHKAISGTRKSFPLSLHRGIELVYNTYAEGTGTRDVCFDDDCDVCRDDDCDVCCDDCDVVAGVEVGISRIVNLASEVRRSLPLSAAHSYIPASLSVTL